MISEKNYKEAQKIVDEYKKQKLNIPVVNDCSHPQEVRCHDGHTYCQLCSKQTFP